MENYKILVLGLLDRIFGVPEELELNDNENDIIED